MRVTVLAAAAAMCLITAGATAAPYSDLQGIYTLDLPDDWMVEAESKGNAAVSLKGPTAQFNGSTILVAISQRGKSLDEDFRALAFNEPTDMAERTVGGAPCISGKIMVMSLPAKTKSETPPPNFVFDRIVCAITVERDGKTIRAGFTIMSMGGDDVYAKQHAVFEAMIESIKWTSIVSPGDR